MNNQADNFDQFKFDRASLSAPRPPGISAYLRVKNGEQFLRLAIESHLPFYDEIIAVYNDCTDRTPQILRDLAEKYPTKIKVYHYLPKVHPVRSVEHAQTPDDSVHGLANYYNYALSKTTFNTATKLDDDHFAIASKIAPLIKTIRADIAASKQKIYMFSGINLFRDKDSNIGVVEKNPFSGNRDINYHPVNAQTIYHNSTGAESFNKKYRRTLPTEYMGIMYFHLKGLKKEFAARGDEHDIITFDEFCSGACHRRLRAQLNPYERMFCALYKNKTMRRWKYQLTGTPPRLNQVRLARLADDLHGIGFKRDAVQHLE
ncbi:hypothetical protein [Candidatus Spongiihabitans sp.]|uniref:hypothetical protein n=1 Tax=Candidatus Spongiihabitans sp. TaxID=3101308 RepID=UPI003C7EC4F0